MFTILLFLCIGLVQGFTTNQPCITALPYQPYNINHAFYGTWYGKLGDQLNGTHY